jgi:hypothetical protein
MILGRFMKSAPGLRVSVYLALALASALALFPPRGNAQNDQKPKEPDYVGSFFLLDASGDLKPLERQTAGMKGKVKALGFGGGEASYQVQGEHSTIRIPDGAPVAIIVKLAKENQDDPASLMDLYTLKSGKNLREITFVKRHFMGGTNVGAQDKQVELAFAKYGESSVKITPSGALPAGEYAIAMHGQKSLPIVFLFGVDPPNHP